MIKVKIGITNIDRKTVTDELAKVLADETVIYAKTKNAYWNMKGVDFYDKHIFFELQFKQLNEMIDRVAEHIRFFGHYVPATLNSYLNLTHLTEQNQYHNNNQAFIKELLADHESIIMNLRDQIKLFSEYSHDLGTRDLIASLMKNHKKMAWFLHSHLTN